MSLTHLTSYTAQEWFNLGIKQFDVPPKVTKIENPDPNVKIEPYGWVGTHLFAFRMTSFGSHKAKVEVDNSANEQMDINVTPSQGPEDYTTYWTVETEPDNGKDNDWSVTYDVKKEEKETGKWVFTKGKDEPDDKSSRKGCLGVFAMLLP